MTPVWRKLSRHFGLNYFPDEPICILKQRPLTFTMVCGLDTYLMSGTTWRTAAPVGKVLSPRSGRVGR